MLLFILLIIAVYMYKSMSFKKTSYYQISGNTYLSTVLNKGRLGEYLIYEKLSFLEWDEARFLCNLYIPNGKGSTTELDVVMISKSGVYVFESKNYSGWIFGNENQQYWTQTLLNGGKSRKERFYNPIRQNRSHIKNLRRIVGDTIPIHSVIVFSDRCELKNITYYSTDVNVIQLYQLVDIVKAIENHFGVRCLNKEAIENLYSLLYPYAQVSDAIKKHHIKSIKDSLAGQERQKADCHINERETMEQWEKEYIDAVTKSRRAKEQGKTIDCAYEEGYDSSRWVEMTLPDGKKHYIPKESVGNRSRKGKYGSSYQEYNDSCWNEVEKPSVTTARFPDQPKPPRYYSEKVSFFRTVLKTIRRLLILLAIAVLLIGVTENAPETQTFVAGTYAIASLAVVLHAVYYILRCLLEKNLRL